MSDDWDAWKKYVLSKIECIEKNLEYLSKVVLNEMKEEEKAITKLDVQMKIVYAVLFTIFSALAGVVIKMMF